MKVRIIRSKSNLPGRFFIWMVFLLFWTLPIAGCGKSADSGKPASSSGPQVKKVKAEEGVVVLPVEKQKAGGVKAVAIIPEALSAPIFSTAVLELNADRVAKISTRTSGKIVTLIASLGDRVKEGQDLAYFDSPELSHLWAEHLKTESRIELARKNLKREETLFENKVSPEKDVLRARQEVSALEMDLDLIKEKFHLLGVNINDLEAVTSKGDHPLIPITSPISGVVIEKIVSQGEVVSPEKRLFTVANLSTLWVQVDIYEKDIERIKAGMGVKVSVAAFPNRLFHGKISYISDVVEEKTRVNKARVTIDNESGLLKPGMFATVSVIGAIGSTIDKIIAVPEEALLIEGTERYVFIQIGPDRFKKQGVKTGRNFGRKVEITGGLKEGDRVILDGVLIVKAEFKKELLAQQ